MRKYCKSGIKSGNFHLLEFTTAVYYSATTPERRWSDDKF